MNIDIPKILEKLSKFTAYIRRYRGITFLVILAIIYGFLIFRINSLNSQQPSESDISVQLKGSKSLRIDETINAKIKQLQDNSVKVKSLFNDARKNPFSE